MSGNHSRQNHAANVNASPEKFEELVAPEFWEVGASGRRYSREFALSVLKRRGQPPEAYTWRTADFHVTEAGMDSYLEWTKARAIFPCGSIVQWLTKRLNGTNYQLLPLN